MAAKYEYKLLLVVNEKNMKKIQEYWASLAPDNTTFPPVKSNSKLLVASMDPDNVTFVTKPKPSSAHATLLQLSDVGAAKANSKLQIITVPFVAGTTRKRALDALQAGALKHLTDNCQHYSLFTVVAK